MFRFHQAHGVDERGRSFGQRGGNPGLPALGDGPGSLPRGSEVSSCANSKAPPTPFSAFAQCRDLDSDDGSSSESLRVRRPKRRRHVSARSRLSSDRGNSWQNGFGSTTVINEMVMMLPQPIEATSGWLILWFVC